MTGFSIWKFAEREQIYVIHKIHAEIAFGPTIEHLSACHPALHAHAERLRALPVFQKIYQPFIPPTQE